MRIISFINKKKVIKKILTNLNIFKDKKNQRAPPVLAVKHNEPEIISYGDGGPEYEELVYEF